MASGVSLILVVEAGGVKRCGDHFIRCANEAFGGIDVLDGVALRELVLILLSSFSSVADRCLVQDNGRVASGVRPELVAEVGGVQHRGDHFSRRADEVFRGTVVLSGVPLRKLMLNTIISVPQPRTARPGQNESPVRPFALPPPTW